MLILHGIYDNGRIEIEEKDLPKGKAKIKVILEDEKPSFLDLPARGMWKNRVDMKDSVGYVNKLRRESSRRFLS